MEKSQNIICDNGSGFLKIGFQGEDAPAETLQAIVGRLMLRSGEKINGKELKDLYVCDETTEYRSMLDLKYPLGEGIVKDWNDMELIWDYAFQKKLKIGDTYGDRNILLTEAVMNPRKNRVKMAEIMFEKYGFKGIKFGVQAVLSLFSKGLSDGLVMDSGDGVSHTIPVSQGQIFQPAIGRLNVAGRHTTEYLCKQLLIAGYAFNSTSDFETVRTIKEKMCYVAHDIERERKLAKETCVLDREYVLPNKQVIKIGRERFEGPEVLFDPSKIGIEQGGIPELIFDTINHHATPIDYRKFLYSNILITGGSTMFPGFPTRVETDMNKLFEERVMKGRKYDSGIEIKVIDPFNRRNGVFVGGSLFAGVMENSNDGWISKQKYDEEGDKCLGSSLSLV